MAEYIDREALVQRLNAYPVFPIFGEDGYFLRATVIDVISKQPTADVVEVRNGKWKKVSEKYPRYVCTNCNHLYNNKEYKRCPFCGAKMDGKGEGE